MKQSNNVTEPQKVFLTSKNPVEHSGKVHIEVRKKRISMEPKPDMPASLVFDNDSIDFLTQAQKTAPAIAEKEVSKADSKNILNPSAQDDMRVLRLPEVLQLVGVSRSTFYNWLNPKHSSYDSTVPRPVRIGKRLSAWYYQDILSWLATLQKV